MNAGRSLKDSLAAQIAADGPISLAAYMAACLHARGKGYYSSGGGIGRDFITAPEISQIFGELIGLWLVQAWRDLGAPERFSLVEIGPGRGALMRDLVRVGRAAAGFAEAAQIVLVEPAQAMRTLQRSALNTLKINHIDDLNALPDGPALIVANEFLDCLPARSFVRGTDGVWRERVVGLGDSGELAFGLTDAANVEDTDAANGEHRVSKGVAELEIQVGIGSLLRQLSGHFANFPSRALFIDYGLADSPPGDTLRAFRAGRQTHPLEAPGEDDLTVDVDFARLTQLAAREGLDVHGPAEQGAFLMALGAQARLDALIRANPEQAQALYEGVRRLVDPADMGSRFKVVALSSPGLPDPPGF